MKRQIQPFIENLSEATAACLVTMVQGNLLAITLADAFLGISMRT
jgi:hypothetical protein